MGYTYRTSKNHVRERAQRAIPEEDDEGGFTTTHLILACTIILFIILIIIAGSILGYQIYMNS